MYPVCTPRIPNRPRNNRTADAPPEIFSTVCNCRPIRNANQSAQNPANEHRNVQESNASVYDEWFIVTCSSAKLSSLDLCPPQPITSHWNSGTSRAGCRAPEAAQLVQLASQRPVGVLHGDVFVGKAVQSGLVSATANNLAQQLGHLQDWLQGP